MSNSFSLRQTTILIPAFNEERFLRQCLDSVVGQVDHVLIGDNASTDGTEAICREYVAKHEHIQYIRHDVNIGSVGNLVHLAQLVETEFVLQIGAHDVLPENYIVTLENLLHANRDAVCAYGNCSWLEWDGAISQTNDFIYVFAPRKQTFHRRFACNEIFYGKS